LFRIQARSTTVSLSSLTLPPLEWRLFWHVVDTGRHFRRRWSRVDFLRPNWTLHRWLYHLLLVRIYYDTDTRLWWFVVHQRAEPST